MKACSSSLSEIVHFILEIRAILYWPYSSIMSWRQNIGINPSYATWLFLCPLKTPETLRFSVFRAYRKRPAAWNYIKEESNKSLQLITKFLKNWKRSKFFLVIRFIAKFWAFSLAIFEIYTRKHTLPYGNPQFDITSFKDSSYSRFSVKTKKNDNCSWTIQVNKLKCKA